MDTNEMMRLLLEKMDTMKTEMNQGFDQMNQRFDRTESAILELKQIVNDNFKNHRSHIGHIDDIQKRQQRVIEMLSSRSVESDANIKALEDSVSILQEKLAD